MIWIFSHRFVFFIVTEMAATSFKEGYNKVYSDRLAQLTDETTEDDVRKLYDDWATGYDKVHISG